ncbi:hypothetical protein FYL78_06125, partial [Salmonella enterica subsp. enterica serovar Typhimurium]
PSWPVWGGGLFFLCFFFFFDSRGGGPPPPPGGRAAPGRRPRPRRAVAGAPASLRRTRWRGFGLSLRSDA